MKDALWTELTRQESTLDETITKLIPRDAFTLHRLLGYQPSTENFSHNATNKLPYDLIILDESTMIDLPLMVHFFRALANNTKVILLGDKDQLASVGAGSVFADLILRYGNGTYPLQLLQLFETTSGRAFPATNSGDGAENPNRPCVTTLNTSFRFTAHSAIGAVCRAVQKEHPQDVAAIFASVSHSKNGFTWYPQSLSLKDDPVIQRVLKNNYIPLTTETRPAEALAQLRTFCLLAPTHAGNCAVEAVNAYFMDACYNNAPHAINVRCFSGMPILITANDYENGLFNGDMGILLQAEGCHQLSAWFPDNDGLAVREFPINRLPAYTPAYCMTIHKSQGSEFDAVYILLSNKSTRFLTRELLYTALSRGKKIVELRGEESVIASCCANRVQRASGL